METMQDEQAFFGGGVVGELCSLTGEVWEVVEGEPYEFQRARDGLTLSFWFHGDRVGVMHLSRVPGWRDNYQAWREAEIFAHELEIDLDLQITCAVDRGPAWVAKHIVRRLLPQATKLHEDHMARFAVACDELRSYQAWAAEWARRRESEGLESHRAVCVPLREPGRVRISIHGATVSADTALAIMRVLANEK